MVEEGWGRSRGGAEGKGSKVIVDASDAIVWRERAKRRNPCALIGSRALEGGRIPKIFFVFYFPFFIY